MHDCDRVGAGGDSASRRRSHTVGLGVVEHGFAARPEHSLEQRPAILLPSRRVLLLEAQLACLGAKALVCVVGRRADSARVVVVVVRIALAR